MCKSCLSAPRFDFGDKHDYNICEYISYFNRILIIIIKYYMPTLYKILKIDNAFSIGML